MEHSRWAADSVYLGVAPHPSRQVGPKVVTYLNHLAATSRSHIYHTGTLGSRSHAPTQAPARTGSCQASFIMAASGIAQAVSSQRAGNGMLAATKQSMCWKNCSHLMPVQEILWHHHQDHKPHDRYSRLQLKPHLRQFALRKCALLQKQSWNEFPISQMLANLTLSFVIFLCVFVFYLSSDNLAKWCQMCKCHFLKYQGSRQPFFKIIAKKRKLYSISEPGRCGNCNWSIIWYYAWRICAVLGSSLCNWVCRFGTIVKAWRAFFQGQ